MLILKVGSIVLQISDRILVLGDGSADSVQVHSRSIVPNIGRHNTGRSIVTL